MAASLTIVRLIPLFDKLLNFKLHVFQKAQIYHRHISFLNSFNIFEPGTFNKIIPLLPFLWALKLLLTFEKILLTEKKIKPESEVLILKQKVGCYSN